MSNPNSITEVVKIPQHITHADALDLLIVLEQRLNTAGQKYEQLFVLDPITRQYLETLRAQYRSESATISMQQSLNLIPADVQQPTLVKILRNDAFLELVDHLIQYSERNAKESRGEERAEVAAALTSTTTN